MTDLTDFTKTDLVDDHLAADYLRLLPGTLLALIANTETLSATKELADSDCQIQSLTASGGDQVVAMPPEATTNHWYMIENAGGSNSVIVKDDSESTTFITLSPGDWVKMMSLTATGWVIVSSKALSGNASTVFYSNLLINGGFDFAQRQAPGTLTTIADNKYSSDRWRVTRENADVQYQRADATGETGLTSFNYGIWKKITNAGKLHVCQIVEGLNSVPLRGKTVIFQAKMKASSSKTIRMAVLELQTAGTIDTIPATLVTAFGADSTDPTLGANVAVITAAESKSVTTSWQSFSVSVAVPANSKNILCAFWTDADFAANDTLSVAEAGLFLGSSIVPWSPRFVRDELALVQRYYSKTFGLDVAPAQNVGLNSGEYHMPAPVAGAVSQRGSKFVHPVPMRISPTVTTYSPAAASAEFYDGTNSVACTAITTVNASPSSIQIQCTGNASTTAGASLRVHVTADAEL